MKNNFPVRCNASYMMVPLFSWPQPLYPFEAVYCFICGPRRVTVTWHRMIVLFISFQNEVLRANTQTSPSLGMRVLCWDHSFLNLSCLRTFWVSNIPRYFYFASFVLLLQILGRNCHVLRGKRRQKRKEATSMILLTIADCLRLILLMLPPTLKCSAWTITGMLSKAGKIRTYW